MGRVYAATDTRLSTERAIKLLNLPEDLSEEQREHMNGRLTQEARASMALSDDTHHVVRVFDVGESEDGQPYLVMELLEGVSLAEVLKAGAMEIKRALKIAREIAQALSCAHTRGMIHRDLKPDNVMLVERSGSDDFVKLLDFGLVKMEGGDVRTQTGIAIGTVQYMSPEQLRGLETDARMDVFAFGCVLYEMLSGVRANPGTSQPELFAVLLDAGVEPIASLQANLDPALTSFVDACVSLEPADRPANGHALLNILDSLSHGSQSGRAGPDNHRGDMTMEESPIPPTASETPAPRNQRTLPVLALLFAAGIACWWFMTDRPTKPVNPPAAVLKNTPKKVPKNSKKVPEPPKTISPTLPAYTGVLPTTPNYTAKADPKGWSYSGISDDHAYAGFVIDLVFGPQNPNRHKRWAQFPEHLRYWMNLHFESIRPTDGNKGLMVSHSNIGRLRSRLRGPLKLPRLGTIWSSSVHGVIFETVNCRQLRPGDVLVTTKWVVRGYGKNQCEGRACADTLARILKQGSQTAEKVRLRLNIERSESESGKKKSIVAACTIKP